MYRVWLVCIMVLLTFQNPYMREKVVLTTMMIIFHREHLQTLNGTWQSMSSSSCCRYSALSQTNQISWLTSLHKTSNTCTNKVNHIQIYFYEMKKRQCIFLYSYLYVVVKNKKATRKTNTR